jgi:hypothetical protein
MTAVGPRRSSRHEPVANGATDYRGALGDRQRRRGGMWRDVWREWRGRHDPAPNSVQKYITPSKHLTPLSPKVANKVANRAGGEWPITILAISVKRYHLTLYGFSDRILWGVLELSPTAFILSPNPTRRAGPISRAFARPPRQGETVFLVPSHAFAPLEKRYLRWGSSYNLQERPTSVAAHSPMVVRWRNQTSWAVFSSRGTLP